MKLAASTLALLFLAACPNAGRNDSVKASNEGTRAYSAKQYETAIEAYKRATEKWSDNHVAWYGLAGAYAGKKDWKEAADAMEHAVQVKDDEGMYHMMYGYMLYEKAIQTAKEDAARRESKKPEEVQPDLTQVNFEKSLQHLQQAVKLNNDLWRAHYYIGRINRDTGKFKEAAEAFTKALQSAPPDPGPWVALGELYRLWDYTDQAISVAEQGIQIVPGANEKSDIYYVLGMGYDDKGQYDKSIDAFTKALESRRDNHKAKFQRGQAYFRKGDYVNAKRDLEEFSKSGGTSVEFAKQQASKMLMDIAAKSMGGGAGGGGGEKMSPEDLVKKSKEKKGG
jgi:tetratricopeptide (TPR) repeat protein